MIWFPRGNRYLFWMFNAFLLQKYFIKNERLYFWRTIRIKIKRIDMFASSISFHIFSLCAIKSFEEKFFSRLLYLYQSSSKNRNAICLISYTATCICIIFIFSYSLLLFLKYSNWLFFIFQSNYNGIFWYTEMRILLFFHNC